MTTDSRCAGEIPCYLNDNGECVATDEWMCTRPQWTHGHPLRVVTLCSGYDSQCLALDEPFPFSVTTRESASNQEFLITYKTMKAKPRIRKITPRECFRLMGVGEAQIDVILSAVSNSAAYVLAGNSIVAGGHYTDENGNVNGVLYNIFRKLLIETGRDKQPNDQLTLF